MKLMNKCVNTLLLNNTKIEITFKSTKLNNCFNAKDKIDLEDNHGLICDTKYPEPTCIDDYVAENARRIIERIKDHNGKGHISHVLKCSIEKSHENVNTVDFIIIDKIFHNNK